MNLEARNLVKAFKGRTVVNKVSIKVETGEIVGLLGPNGAGKTTSFYMMVGLERPDEGEVFINDVDISKLPMYKRAELGISYLTQEASIFRKLTVRENIMAILETLNLNKEERQQKLNELLREFSIRHVEKRKGTELSGGERRRVEIARCLALEPKFILLDEPFAGVDPLAVADIQEIIKYLKKRGMGILITDHNVRETLHIVDRAYILNEGKILLEGSANEIANSDIAKKFYLGTNFTL
ncbi:MAG: LPS export ABC transporter ATP-binding protein [Selenomonadaceae bacterium]|nr:LPS export ABC transporter ATP-binding protein [Selenomonadaceae bacterium]